MIGGAISYIALSIWKLFKYKLRYEGDKMIIETRDGTLVYKGEHKNGKKHGKGREEENDFRYEGDFFEN